MTDKKLVDFKTAAYQLRARDGNAHVPDDIKALPDAELITRFTEAEDAGAALMMDVLFDEVSARGLELPKLPMPFPHPQAAPGLTRYVFYDGKGGTEALDLANDAAAIARAVEREEITEVSAYDDTDPTIFGRRLFPPACHEARILLRELAALKAEHIELRQMQAICASSGIGSARGEL